jgi:hypothetical protein
LFITPRLLINQSLAILADAVGAIIIALNPYTGWFAALGADQHHIRNIDRSLELDAARVDVAAR